MKDPNCDFCNAVQGICTECNACFSEHCDCDPCQHGKPRDVECVFCGRMLEDSGVQYQFLDVGKVVEWASDLGFGGIPDQNQGAVEQDAEEKS